MATYTGFLQKMVLALFLSALFVGCAHYPMGLTREQWEALPPEKQSELVMRQAEVNEQRQREAIARAERERLLAEQAEQERLARLEQLRANPRLGDMVDVILEGGYVLNKKDQRMPLQPVATRLVRGESKLLEASGVLGNTRNIVVIPLRLDESGQSILVGEVMERQGRVVGGRHVALVDVNWRNGEVYDIAEIVGKYSTRIQNARLRIRYTPSTDATPTMRIEHR